jgi:Asp-tRNA(Asn)/Glu-tRNA(Gln) amidotransferase A subunit family amidase
LAKSAIGSTHSTHGSSSPAATSPTISVNEATGHPSMSMPCGWIDGLPVGLMLTGRRFDERLLYRAASSLELHLAREGITGREAGERSLPAKAN